ncbi:MAG: TOBE domain-containing protein, partial [Noviherbaspirillum sp.]
LMQATIDAGGIAQLGSGLSLRLNPAQLQKAAQHKEVVLGLRAHSLRLAPHTADDFPIEAEVELAEISGSETYVHAHRGRIALVAQLPGVHDLEIGSPCSLYCRSDDLFLYGTDGALLFAPKRPEAAASIASLSAAAQSKTGV